MIKEQFVKDNIIRWLMKNGWGKNIRPNKLHSHGVDIRVYHRKQGRYYLIETKGESKNKNAGNHNNFIYALGELIIRMNVEKTNYKYGLGYPELIAKKALKKIPYQIAKKLNLYILSVNKKGKVIEYSHKDIKKYTI